MAKPKDKTIASIKRARTKRLATLITKSYLLYRRKEEDRMYTLICEEFVSLGGVYVKFLQGVLLKSKVMKKWHNPEKLKIFENLDYEPINISSLLQGELSRDQLSQIALVQPEPFAAGSFGQVYYAQLRDGSAVVIKVLRPMIRELLKHDIKLLSRFYKMFFLRMYRNMSIDINTAFQEFTEATLRETDYRQEANFANEMLERYKNHELIKIPKTYTELCTDNIIVQEYIQGISLAHIIKIKSEGVDPVDYVNEKTGSNLKLLLEAFGYESLIGIFEMPRTQGDPHPGNIRIMEKNRIGLIDFGISAASPVDKNGIYGLLNSYNDVLTKSQSAMSLFEYGLRFFVKDLYKALKRIGEYLDGGGERDYVSEVSEVAGKIFYEATGTDIITLGKSDNDSDALVAINKLVNKGNRFGLVVKLETTDILRAIQTYISLLSSLNLYKDVMPPALSRAVEYIEKNHPEIAIDNNEPMDISSAIETVFNWLERVADRDPILFNKLAERMHSKTKPLDVRLDLDAKGE